MIRRSDIPGAFLFLIVAAVLQYVIFDVSPGESIGRGTAMALAYLAGVGLARRAREGRVAHQPISLRVRVSLSVGVLLFVVKFGLDLSKTGSAGIRAVLGVVALTLLLFGAFEVARKTIPSR